MSEQFDYEGYHKCKSHCLIDIHKHDKYTVVIATEAGDNEGTSVTNMAEHIATNVCKKHHIQMETLIWVEHYPPRKDSVFHPEPHGSWDLVSFKIEKAPIHGYWDYPKGVCVFTSPKWQPLSPEQKDRLVEGDTTVFKKLKAPVRDNFFES